MTEKQSRQLKWYHENKEKALARDKAWRKANPDKVAEQNRRYRENFKKKHGISPSQYYAMKRKAKTS